MAGERRSTERGAVEPQVAETQTAKQIPVKKAPPALKRQADIDFVEAHSGLIKDFRDTQGSGDWYHGPDGPPPPVDPATMRKGRWTEQVGQVHADEVKEEPKDEIPVVTTRAVGSASVAAVARVDESLVTTGDHRSPERKAAQEQALTPAQAEYNKFEAVTNETYALAHAAADYFWEIGATPTLYFEKPGLTKGKRDAEPVLSYGWMLALPKNKDPEGNSVAYLKVDGTLDHATFEKQKGIPEEENPVQAKVLNPVSKEVEVYDSGVDVRFDDDRQYTEAVLLRLGSSSPNLQNEGMRMANVYGNGHILMQEILLDLIDETQTLHEQANAQPQPGGQQ